MGDLFDPHSFGPCRYVVTRRVGPARFPRRLELFDDRAFGPRPSDEQLPRWRRDWHRHGRWLANFSLPERLVIIVGKIAVAYLLTLFGMLVGAGLSACYQKQHCKPTQRFFRNICCITVQRYPAGCGSPAARSSRTTKRGGSRRTSRGCRSWWGGSRTDLTVELRGFHPRAYKPPSDGLAVQVEVGVRGVVG
jgi:hypothetical protein